MAKNNESNSQESPEQRSERLKREGMAELKRYFDQTDFGNVRFEFAIVNGKVTMYRVIPEYTRI